MPLVQAPINNVLSTMRVLLAADSTLRDSMQGFRARADSTGQIALEIAWRADASADKKAFFAALREKMPNLIDPHRQKLQEQIGDMKFQTGAFDFFQVNSSLTPQLVQIAMQMADLKSGQRALDLFCGAGLFGLFMAREKAKRRRCGYQRAFKCQRAFK